MHRTRKYVLKSNFHYFLGKIKNSTLTNEQRTFFNEFKTYLLDNTHIFDILDIDTITIKFRSKQHPKRRTHMTIDFPQPSNT